MLLLYSMVSIFIMYSNDRRAQLEMTISCLRDMPGFDKCQKLLVVDGKPESFFPDFDWVCVPRLKGQFNWAAMWEAGVASAKHDLIWYLDSDRLLPANYLQLIISEMRENAFLFSSFHFWALQNMSLELCKEFLARDLEQGVFVDEKFIGKCRYEPRFIEPPKGPGKNVMSGNTAFLKSTFLKLGGVDPWYTGHGAFADTDFHMAATQAGCKFIDLKAPELHYHHAKKDGVVEVDEITLRRMGLDNFIYYCNKWGLPLVCAEALAYQCSILQPKKYVKRKLNEIKEGLHG